MRFISKMEAQQIIGPYVPKIVESIEKGYAEYFINPENAKFRTIYSTSTAASAVHNHITEKLVLDFYDVPGVYFKPKKNLILMLIHNEGQLVALRINKFNEKLLAHLNKTKQSDDYAKLELEGMPKHAPLFVGYRLNKLTNALKGIYITCRYKDLNEWDWDLRDSANEQPKLFEFPAAIALNNEQTESGRKITLLNAKDGQKDGIQ